MSDSAIPSSASRDPALLRLGTRGSRLARMQSQWVADQLARLHPGLRIALEIITTSGDQIADRPLHEAGGKGLFVRELELALLDRRIDLAVHSYKDVPVTMPLVAQDKLVIAATPAREDARDVLISTQAGALADLPPGSRVATGSLRRRCQIMARHPALKVMPIRGNIDTRLNKLAAGDYDAMVLALAGLRRGGLYDPAKMTPLEIDEMTPAAGQGALAIQCRRDDARTRLLVARLHDPHTATMVVAERKLVALLQGDCHSPIGVLATASESGMTIRAAVGGRGGEPPVLKAAASGSLASADALVRMVYADLVGQGVLALLGVT